MVNKKKATQAELMAVTHYDSLNPFFLEQKTVWVNVPMEPSSLKKYTKEGIYFEINN